MKMVIFLIIFLSIFSLSFQTVQAVFYCDDYLKEVYIKDETTQELTHIATGNPNGKWNKPNYFYDLEAAPGDLIQITCCNTEVGVYGGGCFLINNICLCSNFDNGQAHTSIISRTTELDSKSCQISLDNSIVDEGTYSYTYTIPMMHVE